MGNEDSLIELKKQLLSNKVVDTCQSRVFFHSSYCVIIDAITIYLRYRVETVI